MASTFGVGTAATPLARPFWRLVSRVRAGSEETLRYSRGNLRLFAVVAIVSFLLYWVVWWIWLPQYYENLPLRIGAALLATPFLFVEHWPTWALRWLAPFFLLCVTYFLPFFFQYMLLQNIEFAALRDAAAPLTWQLSNVAALVLLVMLLTDPLLIALSFATGTAAAWGLFLLTAPALHPPAIADGYLAPMPVYLFIVVAGSVFNHHRESIQQEMLRAVSSVGSNIAHELRTPLLGVKSAARGIDRQLPALIDGYERARAAGLPVQPLRRVHLDAMRDAAGRIEREATHANTVIDMLLINAGSDRMSGEDFRIHDLRHCVAEALDRYPWASQGERERVELRTEAGDARFLGSDVLLVHVLFNLLKNALYHTARAGGGEIRVSVQTARGSGGPRIVFEDTGPGIHPAVLPRIFDRFYTSLETGRGSGIGLAFCRMVMESFGGRIDCDSRLGQYTRFTLEFPRVQDDD